MKKVKIILVEWREYPLQRTKKLQENSVNCGLGPLLEDIDKYDAGIDFDITLIITGMQSPLHEYALKAYRKIKNTFFPAKYSKEKINIYNEKKDIYQKLKEKYSFITSVHYKDNVGLDIGAYNVGYNLLKKIGYNSDVLFMNSGIAGPSQDNWLLKYSNQFSKYENSGLCGISINALNTKLEGSPFSPHVQSFFFYTDMSVLGTVFPENLPGSFIKNDRTSLIIQGEIGISQAVLNAGYGISCMAEPDFFYTKGSLWDIPLEELRYKKEYQRFANRI